MCCNTILDIAFFSQKNLTFISKYYNDVTGLLKVLAVEYLNFPENKSIPDTVSSHNAFHHLCFLTLEGKLQHPAFQRAVGLSVDLKREIHKHKIRTTYPFTSKLFRPVEACLPQGL